jgi:hypothetical protein
MKLPELHDTIVITERRINDIHTIKAKIESKLHGLKARTIIVDNVISFKTVNVIITSGFGYRFSNITLLRIYKNGSIIIEKHKNTLQINWIVNLNNLFFLAFCSSTILGMLEHYTTSMESIFVAVTSIGFFLLFVFLGTQFIKYKLTELIESCVYRDSN